jgi:NADP-dependent 3-hydroxy acid dehydrogenase YdfG
MAVMSFAGMVAPGSGSIINISSMAGRLGFSGGRRRTVPGKPQKFAHGCR